MYMPSINENLEYWTNYEWGDRGDEWSEVWGNTENLWNGSLLPRIKDYLPAPRILEIAPGFGRITQYLKDWCDKLILVDLTQKCIDACRERFAKETIIEYQTNDGKSLPCIADRNIDFAFSFDSLVHVEIDVIEGYLGELARTLSANGVAFLHHSNVGAFRDSAAGDLTIPNPHWRGTTVSAEQVRSIAPSVGLSCIRQEIVNWGGPHLTDCFSSFSLLGSRHEQTTELIENVRFMDEAIRIAHQGVRDAGS
jgi:SAM-dependent methyltransferase